MGHITELFKDYPHTFVQIEVSWKMFLLFALIQKIKLAPLLNTVLEIVQKLKMEKRRVNNDEVKKKKIQMGE